MALRLLRVDVSPDLGDAAASTLEEVGAAELWSESGGAFGSVVSAVMGAEATGPAIDLLHERLGDRGSLRALVLPLDAVFPRPAASPESEDRQERVTAAAVSREEVYASISGGAQLSPVFLMMVLLATVVAALGLTKDNTAAVIGAMVVAPLLGPNMALALGLTLGDRSLMAQAAKSAASGVLLCLGASTGLGLVLAVDPGVRELASRTSATLGDIALAIAAGAAGTLAYTTGAPTYLVGVMVAVALLPPTVACGLFLGNGLYDEAFGALLLCAINTVAIVFSSMVTFRLGGMRPRSWWKEERARRTARIGTVALSALLLLLATAIYYSAAGVGAASIP